MGHEAWHVPKLKADPYPWYTTIPRNQPAGLGY